MFVLYNVCEMRKVLAIIIVALISTISILSIRLHRINERYSLSMENVKAYENDLNIMKDQSREFKLTVQQLNSSKDSINQKLNEVRKELGIKDKKISQLQYQLSSINRTDTVLTIDTIFRDPSFILDTIVGDEWFSNHLTLKYPNVIVSSPFIKTENYVIISDNRETINPPKKFFLLRWFQKKHTIVEVNIKENNPYVNKEVQRFIKIIK